MFNFGGVRADQEVAQPSTTTDLNVVTSEASAANSLPRARLQLPSTYNFALFTLLLEDDFQSKTVNSQSATVNFACLQLPSTYNFPKMGGGDNGSTK